MASDSNLHFSTTLSQSKNATTQDDESEPLSDLDEGDEQLLLGSRVNKSDMVVHSASTPLCCVRLGVHPPLIALCVPT